MIEFNNFSFTYKIQKKPTLNNINLKINDGEKVLIIGPSGSGKSTLGNCINGLIPHAFTGKIEGSAKIADIDLETSDIYKLNKKIGTVLQDSDAQFVGLTVGEDIAFALENQVEEQKSMIEKVKIIANTVSMEDFIKSSPIKLSGGQKQRVSLAGVLVDEVDILLFDEPLANLDPSTGEKAIRLIDKIHKETKKTIVIIEHRLEDVLICDVDRIILIDNGEIALNTTTRKLLEGNLLTEKGIRDPLYIAALKKANCDLSNTDLSHLENIDLKPYVAKLNEWAINHERKALKASNDEILELNNVEFTYPGRNVKALDDISFKLKRGEMVSVLGKNGAGKSTLAKVIMGINTPDSGKLIIDNEDGTGDTISARSTKIGYVMQNPNHMISHAKIYDEVAFGLRVRGVDEDEIKKRVERALELCSLTDFIKWPISALSYGQKKRVTIASILVMQPKILILDEPTAGQDYKRYKILMEFLSSLNKKTGITILFVTHDMHLALEYTPRAIVMADGKLLRDDFTSNIFSDEELLKKANLKQTSLYNLAKMANIENIPGFIEGFIQDEKSDAINESVLDTEIEFKELPALKLKGNKKSHRKRKKEENQDKSINKLGGGLSYIDKDSFINRLTGFTKFYFFIAWIILCLTTFDVRILAFSLLISFSSIKLSKIPIKHFKPFMIGMSFLIIVNALFIFLFSPNQGQIYIGSKTLLFGTESMRYAITVETLWYLLIVCMKYLTIFPIALVFVSTTNPSEFASSLNKLKINFKVCYSVSLMLRYLPEVIQDYTNISNSQQSRGVDISKNASLKERLQNITHILSPLILSSLDRIDTITNAMILRGFCKEDKRTWYYEKKLAKSDFVVLGFISILLLTSLISRFYFGIFFYYPL